MTTMLLLYTRFNRRLNTRARRACEIKKSHRKLGKKSRDKSPRRDTLLAETICFRNFNCHSRTAWSRVGRIPSQALINDTAFPLPPPPPRVGRSVKHFKEELQIGPWRETPEMIRRIEEEEV